MKKYLTPTLAFLAILFLVLWLTKGCNKPTTKPSEDTEWRLRVSQLQAQIKTKDSLIQEIREKRHIDSVNYVRVSEGLKMRERDLVRKLKEANADIKEIADSLPKVARYVELADSTIAVKDSLYLQEVHQRFMDDKSFRSEMALLADKHVKQVEISDKLMTTVATLEKDNAKLARKLERKKRGARLLTGVALGLGAALGAIILSQ